MDFMIWVWIAVIGVTLIVEFATMELVSIWFTAGAFVPLILAATNSVDYLIQIAIFVVISALCVAFLRRVTKKYLLRNATEKTNMDLLISKQYRMLEGTDFETVGSLKVNDVVWSAVAENDEKIAKGEVVEVVKVKGNKLVVKKAEKQEKAEDVKEKPAAKKTASKAPAKTSSKPKTADKATDKPKTAAKKPAAKKTTK